jgi:hypothetical protein
VLSSERRLGIPTYLLPGDEDRAVRFNMPGTKDHFWVRVEASKAPDGQRASQNAGWIENSDVDHLSVGEAALELDDTEHGCALNPRRKAILFEGAAERFVGTPHGGPTHEAEHGS